MEVVKVKSESGEITDSETPKWINWIVISIEYHSRYVIKVACETVTIISDAAIALFGTSFDIII